MPYCAAVTLVHGMPRLSHFTADAISQPDPAVARLMPLVQTHVRNPSPEVIARKLIFQGDCLVGVHLKNGEVLKQIAEHPKGCRENPLTAEERHTKFIDCVTPCLGDARTNEIYSILLEFSGLSAIDEVTRTFARNQGHS